MDRTASGGASPTPQRRSDSASRRLANLAPGTERRVSGETVPALTGWGGPGCALPRGRGPRLETLVEPTAFRGSLDLGNAPLFPAAKDTRLCAARLLRSKCAPDARKCSARRRRPVSR